MVCKWCLVPALAETGTSFKNDGMTKEKQRDWEMENMSLFASIPCLVCHVMMSVFSISAVCFFIFPLACSCLLTPNLEAERGAPTVGGRSQVSM